MYVIGYVKFMQIHSKVKDIISRTNVVTIFCSYKKKKEKKLKQNKSISFHPLSFHTREKRKKV